MTEETMELQVPTHVGFILDGNRRWARGRGKKDFEGHIAGYEALHKVIKAGFTEGIEYISVYVFSTENWQREKGEVSKIMKLAMRVVVDDLSALIEQNIRVRFLGRREGIDDKLMKAIDRAEETTSQFTGRTLLMCFNYGGQQEIVDAARTCIADGLTADELDEAAIAERLYAPDVPPVDIVVRTSGEQRLSNFMLWRSAYSELYFLQKFWPDMTKDDVQDIIKEYNRRNRRFGA